MIDPILALAHSVQSNRGVFAVLLGSGASRSAGIPTGWEVTLDLVNRVAAMEGVEPSPDPETWFKARHGIGPEYSALLDALAKTAAERRAILHSLFEPTPEERDDGLKLPTKAHRAIARLVARGYVKVIVTTNFDRLMELALQEEGVVPTVISTADATKGAAPLVHQRCVVVKVHGDYLDDRIKNTEAELSVYEPEFDAYLDRILDEFGLIISGWSGDWDPALRAAIERCPTRRYTTFWTTRGKPSLNAQKLMTQRGAQALDVASADEFFESLADKVDSLEELSSPSPLSVGAAVASIKRYASDPLHRIRLNDLLADEAVRITDVLAPSAKRDESPTKDSIAARLKICEAGTEVLRACLQQAAFWAQPHHHDSIKRTISSLVPPRHVNGFTVWQEIRVYSASLAFHAAALGAMEGGNYGLLNALARLSFGKSKKARSALPDLSSMGALSKQVAETLDATPWYFPLSEHFSRRIFRRPTDAADPESMSPVDRLEVFLALLHIDENWVGPGSTDRAWCPLGRFAARHSDPVYQEIFDEAERDGEAWPPIVAGCFRGQVSRFEEVKGRLIEILEASASRFW